MAILKDLIVQGPSRFIGEAKGTKFSNWSDYIRKSNRIGSKVHKGFYLDVDDLASKVFTIYLSEETVVEETTLNESDNT